MKQRATMELLQILNKEAEHSKRDYAENRVGLFWDVSLSLKKAQEKDMCECLARSLSDQGLGNIREIRNSDNDFPDCLAKMAGKEIGIEVTQLRKDMEPCGGQVCYLEWTSGKFRDEIFEIVKRKNEKAQIPEREKLLKPLDLLYVVIYTDEFTLRPENIREYLKQPLGPKPCKIDEAFVLGPYEHADNVRFHEQDRESVESRVEYTAFRVGWVGEDLNEAKTPGNQTNYHHCFADM